MFIFTDFVGSQLKESFEHYKRLMQKRKVRNDRYYASRFYKSQSQNIENKQKSKNMMLSDKEIEG